MMHNDDYFIPETVDEQVERILHAQDRESAAVPLVQELHAVCEEDAALLERVWERYAGRITAQSAPPMQLSIQAQQQKEHIMHTLEDTHETIPASSPHKRKRR